MGFRRPDEADSVEAIRGFRRLGSGPSLLAGAGGDAVSHALSSRIAVDVMDGGVRVLAMATIDVSSHRDRSGTQTLTC